MPDPVPTAGLMPLPQQVVIQGSRRLRGASIRVSFPGKPESNKYIDVKLPQKHVVIECIIALFSVSPLNFLMTKGLKGGFLKAVKKPDRFSAEVEQSAPEDATRAAPVRLVYVPL